MKKSGSYGQKVIYAAVVFCLATAIAAPAQIFTTMATFEGTDGSYPYYGSLIQATDGNFYGTTYLGGSTGLGTIFKLSPSGTLTTLYNFCSQASCSDGILPYEGPVQGTDGNLYGVTQQGGTYGQGTVYQISLAGAMNTLYSFCSQPGCTDGLQAFGTLLQGVDGNFYGTTFTGGANNQGTVLKITPTGTFTTLYSFCAQTYCPDGAQPWAGLIQANDGNFYGTTVNGGAYGYGTVFRITPTGKLSVLHSFNSDDGNTALAGLVLASNGVLYGVTESGGSTDNGTIFKITLTGKLTTLYNFCSLKYCTDGVGPSATLIQGTDGNFYGTTIAGGSTNRGTIFKLTSEGTLTTLRSLCVQGYPNCTDGAMAYGGLLQATSGDFYGATYNGGDASCNAPFGCGTLYDLSTGLGQFVKNLPAGGAVGTAVDILGTNLTGATAVTFNGTPAKFTVSSPSLILTTVPAGATTGKIKVALPGQTLVSNLPFYVLK